MLLGSADRRPRRTAAPQPALATTLVLAVNPCILRLVEFEAAKHRATAASITATAAATAVAEATTTATPTATPTPTATAAAAAAAATTRTHLLKFKPSKHGGSSCRRRSGLLLLMSLGLRLCVAIVWGLLPLLLMRLVLLVHTLMRLRLLVLVMMLVLV